MYTGADLDIILSDIDDISQNVNYNGIVLGGDLNGQTWRVDQLKIEGQSRSAKFQVPD